MSAKRDRRKAEQKDDQRRVLLEVGGKSVTVISARDGVRHIAFACAYHTAEEMLDCDLCRLALKDIDQLAPYRSIVEPDATKWRAEWRAAQEEAVA